MKPTAGVAGEVDERNRLETFGGHPFRKDECSTDRATFAEVLRMRIGAEATSWASTVGKREVPIILEGGLALDCPEAPDECVRTHSRAANAMQSLPRVRYSAPLESRSAWWRADCESEAGAIGFCWLLRLRMGIGEALKWVRRTVGQTGRSRTGSLLASGASRGPNDPSLGQPRAEEGRGWSLSLSLSLNWLEAVYLRRVGFARG